MTPSERTKGVCLAVAALAIAAGVLLAAYPNHGPEASDLSRRGRGSATMNAEAATHWEACQQIIDEQNTSSDNLQACQNYLLEEPVGNLISQHTGLGVFATPGGPYRGFYEKPIAISGGATLVLAGGVKFPLAPGAAYSCAWSPSDDTAFSFVNASACVTNVTFHAVGAFSVTLNVTYAVASYSMASTTIIAAPEFSALPTQNAVEGQPIGIDVHVSPQDSEVAFNGTPPTDSTFVPNGTHDTFRWTPDFKANGSSPYSLRFNATMDGIVTDFVVSLSVADNNRAPVPAIRNATGDITANPALEVVPGHLINFTVFASDQDDEDPISIKLDASSRLQNATPWTSLFQNTTGPSAQFSWIPDWAARGLQYANFTLSDGKTTVRHDLTINVLAGPPVLSMYRNGAGLLHESTIVVTENETLSFNVAVQPSLGINLTPARSELRNQNWSASNTQNGIANFTNVGGGSNWTFTWTPNLTSNGTQVLRFNATKSGLTSYANLTIVVANYVLPPRLWNGTQELYPSFSSAKLTHPERAFLNFTVNASDLLNPVLAMESNLPNGSVPMEDIFNEGTGKFSWKPDWNALGTFYYNFTATTFTATTAESHVWRNLTVDIVPALPVLHVPSGPVKGMENKTLTVNVSVEPGIDVVFNASLSSFPNHTGDNFANFSKSGENWTFRWTPNLTSNASNGGTYNLPFKATRLGLTANANVIVSIARFNTPPDLVLEDEAGAAITDTTLQLNEGAKLNLTLNATDQDAGDTVTRTLATNLTSSAYSFNATSGALNLTPAYGTAGIYYLNFSANDTKENRFANVTLTVVLQPARITVPASPVLGEENAPLQFNVSVEPDVEVLFNGSLALFPNHTGGNFANFSKSGENWTFRWTPNSTSNNTAVTGGTYELRFNATRAGFLTDALVTVVIAEANQPPALVVENETGVPVGTNEQEVAEKGHLRLRANGTDTDLTDNLTYSIKTNLSSQAYVFNATTGQFDLHTPYDTASTFYANFTVTDSFDTVHQNVTFKITRIPARLTAPNTTQHGFEETPLTINVTVEPDIPVLFNGTLGDFPNHTAGNATWTKVGPSDWTFSWTPNTTANQTGNFVARFNTTRLGMLTSVEVPIVIAHLNHAPIVRMTNETGAAVAAGSTIPWTENALLQLGLSVTDEDPEDTTYLLESMASPPGATFQSVTSSAFDGRSSGTFRWTPPAAALGLHRIGFVASDHHTTTFHNLTVNVTRPGPPLQVPEVVLGAENRTLTINVSASPDAALGVATALTNFPNVGGGSATFVANGANGTFTWTPNFTANGTHQVTFSATSKDVTTERTATLRISDTNRAPLVSISSQGIASKSFQIRPEEALRLLIFAADEDGNPIQLERTTDVPSARLQTDTVAIENSSAAIFRYFEWTPGASQVGRFHLKMTAMDASSSSSVQATITVLGTGGTDSNVPTQSTPRSDFVEPLSVATMYDLAYVLGLDDALHNVFLLDSDLDGRFDVLAEDSGRLATFHAAPSLGLFLIRDVQTGALALLNASSSEVAAVTTVSDVDVEFRDGAEPKGTEVSVTIPQKEGWIAIQFADTFSAFELGRVVRSDGIPIPQELVWRADGSVHILDDPVVTYYIQFSEPLDTDSLNSGGSVTAWRIVLASITLLGLAVGGGLWWLRRSHGVQGTQAVETEQ